MISSFFKKNSKGQALPLNTIVIAILVIIVLLVIVVFFTTNVGKSGDQIDKSHSSSCSISNAAISALGYVDAEYSTAANKEEECAHPSFEVIRVIPKSSDGAVCCGTKEENRALNSNN